MAATKTPRDVLMDADEGDQVMVQTTVHKWEAPMLVTNIETTVIKDDGRLGRDITLEGAYGAQYDVTAGGEPTPVMRGVSYTCGRITSLRPAGDDERTDPTVKEAWEEACRRRNISSHVELDTVLDATEGAESVYQITRDARIPRGQLAPTLSDLGLCTNRNYVREFPPDDLDERVEQLRNGELPVGAGARGWDEWGDDDA